VPRAFLEEEKNYLGRPFRGTLVNLDRRYGDLLIGRDGLRSARSRGF